MEIKRTAVFGMGALGLLFGSQIARAEGEDAVTFLMNRERAKRHQQDRYSVNGIEKHFQIEAAEDKVKAREDLIKEYEDKFMNPYIAAARGYVDEIIMPE